MINLILETSYYKLSTLNPIIKHVVINPNIKANNINLNIKPRDIYI